jgi:mannonate dehydratase
MKRTRCFPHQYSFKDGLMFPGDGPGLGVDLDEKLAAKYEYQRAYLPINRKLDGTLTGLVRPSPG